LIKGLAASLGAAAASGMVADNNVSDLMAEGLECLADFLDKLSEILEAYASKERVR